MNRRPLTFSITFFSVFLSPFLAITPLWAAEEPPIQIEANHMLSVEKTNSVQFSGDVEGFFLCRWNIEKVPLHRTINIFNSALEEILLHRLFCSGWWIDATLPG